jgi:hypothetical protein
MQASVVRSGVAVALLVSAACGSSNSNSSSADSGAHADTGTAQPGNDAASQSGSDASTAALTCSAYCASITANCTGPHAQYSTPESCAGVCATFPTGTPSDTSGDTLGCRTYHAGAAAQDPATHCSHAGLTGGDQDPSDTQPGPCGEGCEAFCNAAAALCSSVWTSKEACMTDCKTFAASTTPFSAPVASGNTFACRAYHLTAAAQDPTTHCPHIAKNSAPCM